MYNAFMNVHPLYRTKLMDSLNLLKSNDFGTVLPVMSFNFPIQRALKKMKNHLLWIKYVIYKKKIIK